MNRNELMRNYWRYYRNLENKLIATSSYVEIHRDNFAAFSNEYALLLQSIGAELDNFFKVFCGYNLTDRKSINDYARHILWITLQYCTTSIILKFDNIILYKII